MALANITNIHCIIISFPHFDLNVNLCNKPLSVRRIVFFVILYHSPLFRYTAPLLLCVGKNLELQPPLACVPHAPGSESQHPESIQENISINIMN